MTTHVFNIHAIFVDLSVYTVLLYLSSVTGQFWNVPVHIEHYTGPLKEEDTSIVDRDKLYLITVFPGTGGKQRSFLGEWQSFAWDQKSGIIGVYSVTWCMYGELSNVIIDTSLCLTCIIA